MYSQQQTVGSVTELPLGKLSIAAESVPGERLTPARLRVWGVRSALSLMDQGLTSGAGFGVNVLLARWMSADAYGAFAVAFAGFLFISGFHNVLLLEPLSVLGPSRHAKNLEAYLRAQIAVHALLVGTLSAWGILAGVLLWRLVPGSVLPPAILGVGLTLPFVLLLWLARRMCYAMQRPSIAAAGSAFYFVFVGVGLLALRQSGRLSPFITFVLMGCGSAVAAGMLMWRLGVLKRGAVIGTRVPWRLALKENWKYGRWLVGSTILWSIASQAQTFLVAGVLGLGATGILRAMQLPSLVMTQVNTAIYLLVLPTLSHDFCHQRFQSMRRKTFLVNMGLGSVAGGFVLVLLFFGARLERLFFGGKYAEHAPLIPLLALVPAIAALSVGFSAALRAAQKPHFDLIANGVAAAVGLISAVAFLYWWGLAGACASMVAGLAAYSLAYALCYRRSMPRMCGIGAQASLRARESN
jgi:O-antigen/teichoic acid export membrane protein